ncbi:TPA: porin [Citrobacter gillenii]
MSAIAAYSTSAVNAAMMYGESHDLIQNANKAQHFETMVAYVFDFGLRPNMAYVHMCDNGNTDLSHYFYVFVM